MMKYIILIILLILFIFVSILLIVTILKSKKENPKNAVYDGGYNTDTGLRETSSGKLFSGVNMLSTDTVCINEINNDKGKKIKLYNCNTKQLYECFIYEKIYLGRNAELEGSYDFIYIPSDNGISKIHCLLELANNELYLEDCKSANHTYLNGKRITQKMKLNSNDVIKIGRTKIKIMY